MYLSNIFDMCYARKIKLEKYYLIIDISNIVLVDNQQVSFLIKSTKYNQLF